MTRIGPCPICPLAGTVGERRHRRLEARRARRLGARARPLRHAGFHPLAVIGRAGGAFALEGLARTECLEPVVITGLAPAMG